MVRRPAGFRPRYGDGCRDPAHPAARAARTPPRWKQAVTIWVGFFPTNLLASWLLGFVPGFAEVPLVLRVLATTLMLTPVMTYAVLPWVTRLLRPWLQRPSRARKASS